MNWRRNLTLGLVAGGLAVGGFAAAHGLAEARQSPVVVLRFLLGYFDGHGRFVPTSGRNSTNVDRNAAVMFTFSGAVDMGPPHRATLPLTLAEQAQLAAQQALDPEFDLVANGYEPGVIPRALSKDRGAWFVATGTINPTSVVIAAPQSSGALLQAPGQFFKVLKPGRGERVGVTRLVFNPRYAVATFNRPQEIDYNPAGLDASTLFNVYIDGGPNPVHPFVQVLDLSGSPLAVPFSTTFTTGTRYVQDYSRPQLHETSPVDGTQSVASDADIELTFSEPMDITSFVVPRFQGDDLWTANIRYTQSAVNDINLRGRNLLMQPRVKPQTGGNVIQLRPLQGFGKGPSEFEAIVRTGVTDLSGNNITRQILITFKTLFNPTAEQASYIEETFDTSTQRDPTFLVGGVGGPVGDNVLALWNGGTILGYNTAGAGYLSSIIGSSPATDQTFNATSTFNSGTNIWGSLGINWQSMYTVNHFGARPRTITSFAWRFYAVSSTTPLGKTFTNMIMQMGHANDIIAAAGFPGNATLAPGPLLSNFRDTPVVVVPTTTYSATQLLANGYVKGPPFVTYFNFDGVNPVIFDAYHSGTGSLPEDYWQMDASYPLQPLTYSFPLANPPINARSRTWYMDAQFTYLTPAAEARSLFYDIGRSDARLIPQILFPTIQPQGTSVTFEWEGAKADAAGAIDLSTRTGWLPDVRALSNYRYIRFHATLVNNQGLRTIASVDRLTVPFTYR